MIRSRPIHTVLLLFAFYLVSGCTTYTLREAQDHFNKASTIELRALDRTLLSDNSDASPGDAVSALNEYRLAKQVVTALIGRESGELKKDNLLGTAYVLKAMALWRISDLEGNKTGKNEEPTEKSGHRSTNSAEKRESRLSTADKKNPETRQELLNVLEQIRTLQGEISLGTRDKVLWRALYGFYDHDGGRMEKNYEKARTWFMSAHSRLKESIADVPQTHAVRVYIGFSQLRTMAAWNLAAYIALRDCGNDACKELAQEDKRTIAKNAKEVVCNMRSFWEGDQQVKLRLDQLLLVIGQLDITDTCAQ